MTKKKYEELVNLFKSVESDLKDHRQQTEDKTQEVK